MEYVQGHEGPPKSWNLMFKRNFKDHLVRLSQSKLKFHINSSQDVTHDFIITSGNE